MSDTIYVVSYSSGEYSDRSEWMVAWYATEAEAVAHEAAFDAALTRAMDANNTLPPIDWDDDNWEQRGTAWSALRSEWTDLARMVGDADLDDYDARKLRPATVTPLSRGDAALLGVQS